MPWCRSKRPFRSRWSRRQPSSCTTAWSPIRCRDRAGSPRNLIRLGTTRCGRTARCWSSAPVQPGSRRRPRPRRRAGQRVFLLDERPPRFDVVPSGVRFLPWTTALGYYDDNFIVAVERRTNHLGLAAPPDQAARAAVADPGGPSGAGDRCPRADDPVSGQRPTRRHARQRRVDYLRDYGVLVGRRALVYTNNDSAYAVADELSGVGRRRRDCRHPRQRVVGGPARRPGDGGVRREARHRGRGCRPPPRRGRDPSVRRLQPGAAPLQPGRWAAALRRGNWRAPARWLPAAGHGRRRRRGRRAAPVRSATIAGTVRCGWSDVCRPAT